MDITPVSDLPAGDKSDESLNTEHHRLCLRLNKEKNMFQLPKLQIVAQLVVMNGKYYEEITVVVVSFATVNKQEAETL